MVHLGSDIPYTIVRNSRRAIGSTTHVHTANAPTVRIGANGNYRLSTRVVTSTTPHLPLSSGNVLFVRGINGLMYPTDFSLNRGRGITILSIARNRSGPLGCPRVFTTTSLVLLGGISLLPCLGFSIRGYVTYTHRIGPRVRVVLVSTADNRKVSR